MSDNKSVLLDYRSVKPEQPLWQGGDCGACCLSAILKIPHAEVYARKGKIEPIHFYEVKKLCDDAGLEIDYERPDEEEWSESMFQHIGAFGYPAFQNSMAWWDRMKSFLDKGWVGMAQVAHKRDGHITGHTDHWVLIVGYKEIWTDIYIDGEKKGASREDIVVVSCSATGGLYEETKKDFLQFRGGYNAKYINAERTC